MKKILAILLSVTMLLGCVAVAVNATESDEKVTLVEMGETYYLNAIANSEWYEDDWNPAVVVFINDEEVIQGFGGGDTVEYTIDVATAGTYDFNIIYTCMWEEHRFTIYVDDVEAATITHNPANFIDLETPVLPDPAQIALTEGEHTIKIMFSSVCVLWGITIDSTYEQEVEVDNQGAEIGHGLTITNGVGDLSLSYQFKTTAAFKAFSAKLGYLAADKYFNVSITKRGEEEPIQTWSSNGFDASIGSEAWVSFELDEALSAGEYIVVISPTSELSGDILWKRYDVKDAYGLWESVGSFEGEKELARNTTPAFKVTFTEEAADDVYFAKAGEPNVVAVDNQGADEAHGLSITNNVGGVSVSYQFKTTAAFEAFSAKLGFFSPDKSINVTITDVASEEVIKTWTPNGFEGVDANDSTGAWATFELDSELPAGEYIIQMDPVAGVEGDVIWKKYDVVDANGIFHSTFADEDAWAVNATPCLTFTFTEFAEDDVYFAKAGETSVEPPVVEDTTAEDTTAEETTAPETTAPETTAPETTAPETTAPETTVADTTVADTTAAATTAAGTEAGTAAGTGATGTKAPATTTAAAASEGCKAVVGSMSAIALVAIASAAAVVLKKKED